MIAQDPAPAPSVDLDAVTNGLASGAPIDSEYWVHDLEPVLIEIPLPGGASLPIRYYSLSYLLGVLIAMWLLQWMGNRRRIAIRGQQVSDFTLAYGILGIIVGGRLGWVLFYGLFKEHESPWWPFRIWDGGMASHGGIAGMAAAIWLFSRVHKVSYVHLLDCAAIVAPVGLCLGRIANFINGELWGNVTDVPWAVIFGQTDPAAGWQPRHPSQLYEAFGEGLALFLVLFVLHKRLLPRVGSAAGLFCLLYSVARIACERFRREDAGLERESQILGLSRGEQLTFVLIAFGLFFVWGAWKRRFGEFKIPPDEPAPAA